MRVKDVLARKGSHVVTAGPEMTLAQATAKLAAEQIGALVVTVDGVHVDGIISERDIVRALPGAASDLLNTPVSEIMTRQVHTCGRNDEIADLAEDMTTSRFRHMPVVEDGTLVGIVTIGDIVKSRLDELKAAHDQLVDYISS